MRASWVSSIEPCVVGWHSRKQQRGRLVWRLQNPRQHGASLDNVHAGVPRTKGRRTSNNAQPRQQHQTKRSLEGL